MLTVLILVSIQPVSATDHQIVVIADPHVMAPSLLNKETDDFTAWQNYLGGSRKLIDYSAALLDQAVVDILAMNPKPELVLIAGDLSKDGEQVSHMYVKDKLDMLKGAGVPTLVIPGNHDWGSNSDAVYYNGGSTSPVTTCVRFGTAENSLEKIYANYGFGSTDRESSTLTYACEPIEGLVVIGIDSGTNGVLSATTLNWVCDKARAACNAGKQVMAMMHHPLIPHITGGETFVKTSCISDYENVRNRLADAGISIIFTGHFHTSDIAKDWNADKSRAIYDVNTGSLCSYPCDYRVVTLSEDMCSMSITTESVSLNESFSATAKTRLTNSMTTIVSDKIKAKLNGMGFPYSLLANSIASAYAPKLAQAYILHAEGDENEKTQDLLSSLNNDITLSAYPSYLQTANSMLQDISNYGTDRADHTNDRTLAFLANTGDNSTALSAINNKANVTVTLNGRTLIGDGYYNTICLPFDVDNATLKKRFGDDVELKQLDKSVAGSNSIDLTMVFTSASEIEAGKPYLIKVSEDVVDPTFTDVTIKNTLKPKETELCTFVPVFNQTRLENDNKKILFLGANNTLTWPSSEKYTTDFRGLRCYFLLKNEVGAGIGSAKTFRLAFDGETTVIENVNVNANDNGILYNLQGQRVNKAVNGIYIKNGKKVIIK